MDGIKRFADNDEVQNLANADIFPIEQMSDETDKKVTFEKLNKQILHNADVECSVDEENATLTVSLKDEEGESIASDTVDLPNVSSVEMNVDGQSGELSIDIKDIKGKSVANDTVILPTSSAQATFDIVHPIGEVYVQYPNFDEPSTVYNKNGITSVWTEQNYEGAFFRASGGNAQAFENQETKQSESFKSHKHTFTGEAVNTGGMSGNSTGTYNRQVDQVAYGSSVSGNISLVNYKSGWYTTGNSKSSYNGYQGFTINVAHTHSVTAKGSISDTGGTETRPENYTIKIWKRTA